MRKINFAGKKTFIIIFVLLIILTNFFILGLKEIKNNREPTGDQNMNLSLAIHLRRGEGFVSYGLDPFNIDKGLIYPEANKQPLYPLILSSIASEKPIFFTRAKFLSLIMAGFSLLIIFFAGRWVFGDLVALVATSLFSLNRVFVYTFSHLMAEPLFVLFSFLFFIFIIKGFQNNRWWIFSGVWLGLAYLTKASALLLLIGFMISGLIVHKTKFLKNKYFWLMLLTFILICSPLLVRNTIHFRDPFYNINTKHIFWLDSWRDYWLPYSKSGCPSLGNYLHYHSPTQIFKREIRGIKEISRIGVHALGMRLRRISQYFTGGIVLCLFVVGLIKDKWKQRKVFILSLGCLFFFSTCWYFGIGEPGHLLLPTFPIIYFYGFSLFGKNQYLKLRLSFWMWLNLFIVGVGCLFLIGKAVFYYRALEPPEIPADAQQVIEWVKNNTSKEDIICHGPSHQLKYDWVMDRIFIWVPAYDDFARFEEYLKRYKVKYCIIDQHMLFRRKTLLGDRHPENWRLVYHPTPWERFSIFKLTTN